MTTQATDTTTPDDRSPPPRPRAARRWRRLRWTIRLVVGLPLLGLLLALLLMHSPLVGWVVAGQIKALTGGEFKSQHAAITINGQLIVDRLSLRVPDLDGPAGEVLSADQAVADIDWRQIPPVRWFTSAPAGPLVTALRLTGPVFRISLSSDDGSVNLARLTPAASPGAQPQLPRIDAIEGRIEFTEHSERAGTFDTLNLLPVSGALMPGGIGGAAGPSVFTVRLQEIGRAPSPIGERRGMVLDGRIDLGANRASLKLYDVSLDAWPPEAVPSAYRELWRRLAVQGKVSQTALSYAPDTGVNVQFTLDDVAIVVPVPAPDRTDGDLPLSAVNGSIAFSNAGLSADLTGLIEGQATPAHVLFETRGLGLESGFRCQISGRRLSLGKNPGFLRYVPPIVREHFEAFSGPTAEIDAHVVVARADPVDGHAAEVKVPEGRLLFRQGTAAFHKFPYPFHDMTGEVLFDDQTIRIVEIRGVGPSGSPLRATGLISPLHENAQVDVKVEVDRVPVDNDLLAVMRAGYRELLEALFNRDQYEGLLAKGVVRTPDAPGDAPVFEFGGLATVRVHVHRPLGDGVKWATRVDVGFDHAGLVPEPFAYPIIANDLRLLITDDEAVLQSGAFQGLRGGRASVEAVVKFGDHPDDPVMPDVRITALDVPVDEMLLNAVPGDEPADGGDAADGPLSAKAILRRLDLRGAVDCRVAISAAAERPRPAEFVGPEAPLPVDYQVEVELEKLTAAPSERIARPEADRLCIHDLSGAVRVTRDSVRIDGLRARLGRLPVDTPASSDVFAPSTSAGEMLIRLEAQTPPEASGLLGRMHAELEVRGLDVADRVEDVVAVFSAPTAALLSDIRERRQPRGRFDAMIRLDAPEGMGGHERPMEVAVRIDKAEGAALRALGGELGLADASGLVVITTGSESKSADDAARGEHFHFENASGRVLFNGEEAGSFRLDGGMTLGTRDEAVVGAADLSCSLADWRLEAGLTRAVMGEFGGGEFAERYHAFAPQGLFDAHIALSGGDGTEAPRVSGWFEPRSLRLVKRSTPIEFTRIAGRIGFDTGATPDLAAVHGSITGVQLATDAWTAHGQGDWQFRREPGGDGLLSLALYLDAQATALDESLRALLPESIGSAAESVSLAFDQPLRLSDARLRAEIRSGEPDVDFSGMLAFDGVSADIGVPIRDAAGTASIQVSGGGSESAGQTEVLVEAPAARLAGLAMTNLAARVVEREPGLVEVQNASAACHGGRIFASAALQRKPARGPERQGSDGPDTGAMAYRVDALMAGVNFAPILDDLARGGFSAVADQDDDAPADSTDATRGTVDARLSLEGVAGDAASRAGRGAIRIANGNVLRLPVVLPLIEVSNLVIPTGDRLNYMQAEYYVDGERAVFEDVRVLSDTISIVGGGTVRWPDLTLDMRFNSRANRRIPIWSDLFEAVRNEIVSTTVTGTVEQPVIRAESLTTTRRLLGGTVAGETGPRD